VIVTNVTCDDSIFVFGLRGRTNWAFKWKHAKFSYGFCSNRKRGRGLLTVVVVHETGDMQPGPGFFELAQSRVHKECNTGSEYRAEKHILASELFDDVSRNLASEHPAAVAIGADTGTVLEKMPPSPTFSSNAAIVQLSTGLQATLARNFPTTDMLRWYETRKAMIRLPR
jgi:hypothetical protein